MASFHIIGGSPLCGRLKVQGSKNAVLPMMAASVLLEGTCVLSGVPLIADVFSMLDILNGIGVKTELKGHELTIDAKGPITPVIPKEQMIKMRSSIILLGALLGRCKQATAYLPGGCLIGKRPIDLHLKAMRALGARIREEGDEIQAGGDKLTGAKIHFPFPSVGATENALLASVRASGITELTGCAMEPEVEELCFFLKSMGVSIEGIGTGSLTIKGGSPLRESRYQIPGDRIVAGTYLAYTAAAGGRIGLTGIRPRHMESTIRLLSEAGCQVRKDENFVLLEAAGRPRAVSFIRTEPYPGFPTDMQSPMLPVFACADGTTVLEETIFEGRFQAAMELRRLGADIAVSGRRIVISGVEKLTGNCLTSMDLRGGAALVGAALAAEGESCIQEISHILRGYETLEKDIRALGGNIWTAD